MLNHFCHRGKKIPVLQPVVLIPGCQLVCILPFPGVRKPWAGTFPATCRGGSGQQMPCSNHTTGALQSLQPPRKINQRILISHPAEKLHACQSQRQTSIYGVFSNQTVERNGAGDTITVFMFLDIIHISRFKFSVSSGLFVFFITKGQNILWEADINHKQNIYLQKNPHLIKDFCQLPEYAKVCICCSTSPYHMLENLKKQHSYMKFHSEEKP